MTKEVLIDMFVGQFDGFISDAQCDMLIAYHDWCNKNNRAWSRQQAEGVSSVRKADSSCALGFDNSLTLGWPHIQSHIGEFNAAFWDECYPLYLDRYGVLKDAPKHGIMTYKIQQTLPGQGYHVWHCEDLSREHAMRIGTYILYLNDVEDGGETEFLYLGKRVKPKKGRLVIFPAGYTHTHRGNPPLSGEKHILTGWIELI